VLTNYEKDLSVYKLTIYQLKLFYGHLALKCTAQNNRAHSIESFVRQGNGPLLAEFKFWILVDRAETKSSYCPVTEFNAPATLTHIATSPLSKM
jgi:hypothetical protein